MSGTEMVHTTPIICNVNLVMFLVCFYYGDICPILGVEIVQFIVDYLWFTYK